MWFLKKSLLGLALVVGAMGMVHAATVAPFYFESLGASSSEQPGKQQDYWESLMKYKLWGTRGIILTDEGEVRLEDTTGYSGTATGKIQFGHDYHFGGPVLAGDTIVFLHFSNAEMLGGPLRTLASVKIPSWSTNDLNSAGTRFEGPYCIRESVTGNAGEWDKTDSTWRAKVRDGVYVGDDYGSCPAKVPNVDTHLSVPKIPARNDNDWDPGINATPGNQVHYIHVPPDSIYTNEYGTFDKYIASDRMSEI